MHKSNLMMELAKAYIFCLLYFCRLAVLKAFHKPIIKDGKGNDNFSIQRNLLLRYLNFPIPRSIHIP